MDFFEEQRKNRLRSHAVLLLFVLALAVTGFVVHVLASLVALLAGHSTEFWTLSSHAMVLIGGVWLTILLGGFFRWLDVRGGGARLARRFGAEPILTAARSDVDRQLLDVVMEMAVASSVPAPSVWVMRHESSINAFVVGYRDDIALVVSQGALDLLDRDEIQGVVAHEFGHLAQGDLPLNMRLLIALGGLLAVDEVGRLLTGSDPRAFFHPGVVVGLVLRALGSVGVMAGTLLRAAFSRRREFLADACAVQFTRDTFGIASALEQIRELYGAPRLATAYAGELAHLCFHTTPAQQWWGLHLLQRWLATHPTPTQRIAAIDPHFQVKKRKSHHQRQHRKRAAGTSVQAPRLGMSTRVIESVSDAHGAFSDRFNLMVSDTSSALAAVLALFVSHEQPSADAYLNKLGFAYNADFSAKVKHVHEHLQSELQGCPLAVIRHVKPLLDEIQSENRQRLLRNLEEILKLEGQYTLWNYAMLRLLRHELSVDFPLLDTVVSAHSPAEPAQAPGRHVAAQLKVKPLSAMHSEIALLLSLMVDASGATHELVDEDYQRILRCYTDQDIPRRDSADDDIVADMERAFDLLQAQPVATRQVFVSHCAEIALYDGTMRRDENILLQVFAAALDTDAEPAMSIATAA